MRKKIVRLMKAMMTLSLRVFFFGRHGTKCSPALKPQEAPARECWNRHWAYYAFALLVILCLLAGHIATYNSPSRWLSKPRTISDNLKCWGRALHIYCSDNPEGFMPPLPADTRIWVPDLHLLYPDYITEFDILQDPDILPDVNRKIWGNLSRQTPPCLDKAMQLMAQNYVYLGWEALEPWEVEVVKQVRETRGLPDEGIFVSEKKIFRLGRYIYRSVISDINDPSGIQGADSTIPMMLARPRPYQPGDSLLTRWRHCFRQRVFGISPPFYVPTLFKDGHFKFVPLDSAPSTMKAMLELFPDAGDSIVN